MKKKILLLGLLCNGTGSKSSLGVLGISYQERIEGENIYQRYDHTYKKDSKNSAQIHSL